MRRFYFHRPRCEARISHAEEENVPSESCLTMYLGPFESQPCISQVSWSKMQVCDRLSIPEALLEAGDKSGIAAQKIIAFARFDTATAETAERKTKEIDKSIKKPLAYRFLTLTPVLRTLKLIEHIDSTLFSVNGSHMVPSIQLLAAKRLWG